MSTAKFNTWQNPDGTENYKCRSWVNFDGTTTVPTIRASGNVSSVTRNATGDYTVNFTTAMPDADYVIAASGASNAAFSLRPYDHITPRTTTSARVVYFSTSSFTNTIVGNVTIFR